MNTELKVLITRPLAQIAAESGITIIDIRSADEVSSKPCPVEHSHTEVSELLNSTHHHLSDKTNYLLLCVSGKRSSTCATQLQEKEYKTFAYMESW